MFEDLDMNKIAMLAGISLLLIAGGAALGTFVIAPKLEKSKKEKQSKIQGK